MQSENKTFNKIEWRRERLYGMVPGQFDVMWAAQSGRCKLCQKDMVSPTSGRGQGPDVVVIDHCHSTGNVRGLLCNSCNKGIGLLNDDVELLKKAIKYLEDV